MIDRSGAEHLEVLSQSSAWRLGAVLVPCVRHAYPLDRPLRDAVYRHRLRDACRFEDCRQDVDDVVELVADAARILDPGWPRHAAAVAGAAKVGRHLLGPVVGGVESPSPGHRIMRV